MGVRSIAISISASGHALFRLLVTSPGPLRVAEESMDEYNAMQTRISFNRSSSNTHETERRTKPQLHSHL
jgi:hypothetical protein